MTLSVMFFGTVGNAKGPSENETKAQDGVEAVDLGLSVKWANMNVGAEKDSGFGTYFAWGETKPKNYYSWGTYAWSKGDSNFLLRYTATDKMVKLLPTDDAARTNLGGDWRMPTMAEFEELADPNKCTWEWITKDGVNGHLPAHHRLPILCRSPVPWHQRLLLDINPLLRQPFQGMVSGVRLL